MLQASALAAEGLEPSLLEAPEEPEDEAETPVSSQPSMAAAPSCRVTQESILSSTASAIPGCAPPTNYRTLRALATPSV